MKRPAVDVCFTAQEIRPVEVAVVVDVLRATSTIVQTQALSPASTLPVCRDRP